MFAWFTRIVAPVAAIALFAFAQGARADSVVYYVQGEFTNPGAIAGFTLNNMAADGVTFTGGQSSVTADIPANGLTSTLTFHFEALAPVDPTRPGLEVAPLVGGATGFGQFGYFTVSSNDPVPGDTFAGLGFKLTVFQLVPNAGGPPSNTGVAVGSMEGVLEKDTIPFIGGTSTGSTLKLTFTTSSFDIPQVPAPGTGAVHYEIASPVLIDGGVAKTPISGIVSVPLPATASVGFWLLGGVGCVGTLAKLRQRGLTLAA